MLKELTGDVIALVGLYVGDRFLSAPGPFERRVRAPGWKERLSRPWRSSREDLICKVIKAVVLFA